jgi:hypothetical protein
MRKNVAILLILVFLSTLCLTAYLPVKADSKPGGQIVTILPDGTIEPQTAPINHVGYNYLLTGELNNASIDIRRSNVTFNGAGFTVHGSIYLQGDYITLHNTTISSGGLGVLANGSYNRIVNNVFFYNIADISLLGNHTTVSGNIDTSGAYRVIYVEGDYNNITGNELKGIEVSGNHNWVAYNAVDYVTKNGVDNTFLDNNPDGHVATVAPESTTPSPSVPELSWLLIVPFLLSILFVAMVLRHRKMVNFKQ